ncbi:nitrate reductase associated protein [Dyadobacter sp. LJ53]|uniref:nitrate reductase associated protein n=1 Tax=Dyadobacter chenwenxiniae TaxID=2906456 RepID=UPI001F228D54|nr:nitrate reductase associated protein [Dyadobacter chenwenxiniae]MCF0051859.1 nitrate reductase associated protein [Dyadobacter chenwenxiniae]
MTILDIRTQYFQFENDFVNNLRCIPMIVRYKLDSCRIKLQLADWAKLSFEEKEQLADLPCQFPDEIEAYGRYVNALVWKYTGQYPSVLKQIADSWNETQEIPAEVKEKASEFACPQLTTEQWRNLETLQRFALVKLGRSGHEGSNFPIAFSEFGLM